MHLRRLTARYPFSSSGLVLSSPPWCSIQRRIIAASYYGRVNGNRAEQCPPDCAFAARRRAVCIYFLPACAAGYVQTIKKPENGFRL